MRRSATPAVGVRAPRQARSQATHDAIIEATLAAIGEHGPEGFTLADVVGRAGCTTGAVYARFRDKEGLLLAVYEHLVAQWKAGLRKAHGAWRQSTASLPEALRAQIAAQIAARRRDWTLRNAFLARIVSDPAFRRVSAGLVEESAGLLAEALSRHDELRTIPREELRRRAGLATLMIGATIERAITLRDEAADVLPADDQALADALSLATMAMLGHPGKMT